MNLAKILVPPSLMLDLAAGDHDRRPRQQRQTEPFVRGPLPLAGLRVAMKLPAKALAVVLEIYFQAGLTSSKTVSINLSRIGVERTSASRGLRALENAGLVSVIREPGCCPIVTILPAPRKAAQRGRGRREVDHHHDRPQDDRRDRQDDRRDLQVDGEHLDAAHDPDAADRDALRVRGGDPAFSAVIESGST